MGLIPLSGIKVKSYKMALQTSLKVVIFITDVYRAVWQSLMILTLGANNPAEWSYRYKYVVVYGVPT